MDWTAQIDGYCERMGPGLWAEPVNAVTNLAFLVVAIWLWPASRGIERVLCLVLGVIGIGSGLFHTFATGWAALLDVVPIALFVVIYIYAANRHLARLALPWAIVATAAGFLLLILGGAVFGRVPGFAISASYWPIPVLILAYVGFLGSRNAALGRDLAFGAGMLALSITLRSLDEALCTTIPMGTHFAWHLLNAAMLGFMIAFLKRHRLEPALPER
ncbi:ceramidase [Palleronia aestuarii]|uniref:Ceramidase n=1 Tax=Palleronia aestuarii TaxID=568105 RepID=A0A2W7P8L1_9RHOB|nr:ceramidase domain-containing protein [Palleronia aestuarii]PZX19722.1 ceramidase [Palleronia aestuarii]